MNKKRLLLVLLTLAIVTSLSAGTLAVYMTDETAYSGTVRVKKFAFTAAGDQSNASSIRLAPTESETYDFSVSNSDEDATAEVNMHYTITVSYANAKSVMPGLVATLYNASGKEVGTESDGVITFESTSDLAADEARIDGYSVKLEWVNGDSTSQTAAGEAVAAANGTTYPLVVSVSAEQTT